LKHTRCRAGRPRSAGWKRWSLIVAASFAGATVGGGGPVVSAQADASFPIGGSQRGKGEKGVICLVPLRGEA
jgi:hypothetical protein